MPNTTNDAQREAARGILRRPDYFDRPDVIDAARRLLASGMMTDLELVGRAHAHLSMSVFSPENEGEAEASDVEPFLSLSIPDVSEPDTAFHRAMSAVFWLLMGAGLVVAGSMLHLLSTPMGG